VSPDGRRSQAGDDSAAGLAGEHAICDHCRGRRAVEGACMVEFLGNEEGQGLVEYALIIAVIAITVIIAMVFFRDQLINYFSNIGNNLT
jgi:pilus assembly protein Flp/PilA